MQVKENKSLSISVRSFVTAIVVIFVLMVAAYLLTFLIPGGSYARVDIALKSITSRQYAAVNDQRCIPIKLMTG